MEDAELNVVEQAADAAMGAFSERIEQLGGTVTHILFAVGLEGIEPTGLTASQGFEDASDALSFLLAHADAVAGSMGVSLSLMSVPEPGRG